MARLRKFRAYRNLERPYTRVSKYKNKSFIRMTPNPKVVKFTTGNASKGFEYQVSLLSKTQLNIRDNALESARQVANRLLESTVGNSFFRFDVKLYPHHVLRENPLASGAGADRFSTGMQKAFGKPIGVAARVKTGQPVLQIRVDEKHLDTARKALNRAASKLPNSYYIEAVKVGKEE